MDNSLPLLSFPFPYLCGYPIERSCGRGKGEGGGKVGRGVFVNMVLCGYPIERSCG